MEDIVRFIYTYDILRPDRNAIKSIISRDRYSIVDILYDFIYPMLKNALNCEIERLFWEEDSFSAPKFFQLAGLAFNCSSDWAKVYHLKEVTKEAEEYFCSFFKDSFVIGYELSNIMMNIFNKNNIKYINFTIHPIRFLDDIFFMFNTNDEKIYNKLLKYKVDENCFCEKVGICNSYCRKNLEKLDIDDNCALIIGQTKTDASICKESGDFAKLTDYKNEIIKLKEKYKTLYFKPHPCEIENNELINFMQKLGIKDINYNFYHLLSDERLKGVYALSSSCVMEAKYFNKHSEYFYKSAFNIAEKNNLEFNHLKYVGIYGDYFKQMFWNNIFSDTFNTKEIKSSTNFISENKLRNLMKISWAYEIFIKKPDITLTPVKKERKKEKWYKKLWA